VHAGELPMTKHLIRFAVGFGVIGMPLVLIVLAIWKWGVEVGAATAVGFWLIWMLYCFGGWILGGKTWHGMKF
jgi:hypothetical protein